MRVLLVEDHPDVASTTIMLLELLKHTVAHASTGAEAITKAEEFSPEIMLIDIGLPDMEGFEVARRLRAIPKFALTTLVALTGFVCEDRCKAAGFSHYCKKPMDITDLDKFMPKTA